jgi:hypothetical protein
MVLAGIAAGVMVLVGDGVGVITIGIVGGSQSGATTGHAGGEGLLVPTLLLSDL